VNNINLPCHERSAHQQTNTKFKTKNMAKNILIVNDDPQICEGLQNLLQAEGHGVVLATTGKEGIRKFHATRFDLMLVDANLPDTSGWNIFQTLTSINPYLPIVVTERNSHGELLFFEGKTPLAELLDVSGLMQICAGEVRQNIGAGG
jgi:CheY-like chemotaxis protein